MYKWQPQWTQYLIVMLAIEWISYSIIPKSLMKVEAVKWIIIRAFCGKVNWKRSKWIQQTNWVLTDSILNLSSSHFEFYLNWQASQVEWNFFQGVRVCGDGRGKWARSLSKDVGKWKCSGVECCGSQGILLFFAEPIVCWPESTAMESQKSLIWKTLMNLSGS